MKRHIFFAMRNMHSFGVVLEMFRHVFISKFYNVLCFSIIEFNDFLVDLFKRIFKIFRVNTFRNTQWLSTNVETLYFH